MIPPGWRMAQSASERGSAWRPQSLRAYYFDLRKNESRRPKRRQPYTPATSLFAGLAAALDYVRQMGDGNLAAGRDALIANAELWRGDDACRRRSAGTEVIRAEFSSGRADSSRRAGRHRFYGDCKRFREQLVRSWLMDKQR